MEQSGRGFVLDVIGIPQSGTTRRYPRIIAVDLHDAVIEPARTEFVELNRRIAALQADIQVGTIYPSHACLLHWLESPNRP